MDSKTNGKKLLRNSEQENSRVLCDVCREPMTTLDTVGRSKTVQCPRCDFCFLVKHKVEGCDAVLIRLRDFHVKRGDKEFQRSISDRTIAGQLCTALKFDVWPSWATCCDFGIKTPQHFGSLQAAVSAGTTAYELDRVMGDGPAITALAESVPRNRYSGVVFKTHYDKLPIEIYNTGV